MKKFICMAIIAVMTILVAAPDYACNRSSVLENFWPIIFHRTIVLV